MLQKPILVKSTNRNVLAKRHPEVGVADDWFTNQILNEFSYYGLQGIDFFVNWQTREISNEFWIKRIIPSDFTMESTRKKYVQDLIYECDGEDEVKLAGMFFNGKLKYKLFRESNDWKNHHNNPTPILDVTIDSNGEVESVVKTSLETLEINIRELSGGPVSVGSKGLFYSSSTLEEYLSHTDALWPGDVDLVIFDNFYQPKAIIEFKKHTKSEPLRDHKFNRYYPYPDGKKYDRLAILKNSIENSLNINVPLIVLYYPVIESIEDIIFEEIIGEVGHLEATNETSLLLPKNKEQIGYIIEVLQRNYMNK